jgi:dTDP-4-dehydrorhamnose reductase
VTLRVLMFGATGQVATEIRRLAGPDLAVRALGRGEADLADPEACAAHVAAAEADVAINAAAYTAVERAEAEEDLATVVNGAAPGAMARAAAARGMPFLHVSTDYVFDGSGDRPWREDDPVAPLGAYGRSKLAGERAVAAAGGPHVILRTAWVFAAHGHNFVGTMLRVGAERDRLTVVDDQRGGPTAAADIAAALVAVSRAFAAGRGVSGVFHFCGAPTVTWRGFAQEIFRQADWIRAPEVAPIATADWPTPAARPKNSALDCARIAADYGVAQPDWRASLDTIIAELRGQAT